MGEISRGSIVSRPGYGVGEAGTGVYRPLRSAYEET